MSVVLERDRYGRAVLWKCADCGKPFNLGWDDRCNACMVAADRHADLKQELRRIADALEKGKEAMKKDRLTIAHEALAEIQSHNNTNDPTYASTADYQEAVDAAYAEVESAQAEWDREFRELSR